MNLPDASAEDQRLADSVIDKYDRLRSVLTRSEAVEGAVFDTFMIFTDPEFRHGWSVGLIAAGYGDTPDPAVTD